MHSSELLKSERFDFVLALSVLCQYPISTEVDSLADIYPFSEFEEIIFYLDQYVRLGGFIAIINSNYFFEDTEIFKSRYQIASTMDQIGVVNRFDTNSQAINVTRKGAIFFRKIAD